MCTRTDTKLLTEMNRGDRNNPPCILELLLVVCIQYIMLSLLTFTEVNTLHTPQKLFFHPAYGFVG